MRTDTFVYFILIPFFDRSRIVIIEYSLTHTHINKFLLPVKIRLAQYFAVPAVAFVGQRAVTIGALYAFRVPRPVQHIQKELIHNGLVASRATHH